MHEHFKDNAFLGLRIGVFSDSLSWISKINNMTPLDQRDISVFEGLNKVA